MLDFMEKKWNPRYVWFAKAHGRTPQDQMKHDESAWPGGIMTGFVLWMSLAEEEFRKAHPEAFIGYIISDHRAWDKFLRNRMYDTTKTIQESL